MKRMTTTALALAAVTALPMMAMAQEARTGVSHPDDSAIVASPEMAAPVKPSAAIPMQPAGSPARPSGEVYGAYVPYTGAKGAAAAMPSPMTDEQADGAVVMSVVDRPGELREGTLLHTRIQQSLSTLKTEEGARFTAELTQPIEKDGRVVVPIGSLVEGRVTTVHGGRRISGAAMIHLEANHIVLPDGTRYTAHLQLIDTDQMKSTKIDREGSLVRRDHPKETLAAVGLATGGAATAGALIGGGVGAAVGAGIGAGASTVLWLKQDRQETVPEHALLVFSLSDAMPLVPSRETTVSQVKTPMGNPDAMVVGAEQ